MTNTTNAAPTVLTDIVKELKLVARNALRMELISPILAEINRLEIEIKAIDEFMTTEEKRRAVADYKITRLQRLDAEHPNFDNLKKEQEEIAEKSRQNTINYALEKELFIKRIEEEKTAITKIETGETLVSADELSDMVNKLILQEAKNTIIA